MMKDKKDKKEKKSRPQRKGGRRLRGNNDPSRGPLFVGRGQPGAKLSVVKVPPGCQLFPDEYRASAVLETNGAVVVANTYTHTFKANFPFNSFGPQVNYAGGFSNNVPSGSFNLLSGFTSTTGTNAPYNRVIATDYTCEVTVTPSGATPNTVPVIAGISFTQAVTATQSMPVTQIPEQSNTMWVVVPPVLTGAPIRVANSVRFHDFFGLTSSQYLGQHQIYGAPAGADPTRLAYAQVWFRPVDGSSNVSLSFIIRHKWRFVFTDLNVYSTNLPAYLRLKQDNSSPGRGANEGKEAPRASGWIY